MGNGKGNEMRGKEGKEIITEKEIQFKEGKGEENRKAKKRKWEGETDRK